MYKQRTHNPLITTHIVYSLGYIDNRKCHPNFTPNSDYLNLASPRMLWGLGQFRVCKNRNGAGVMTVVAVAHPQVIVLLFFPTEIFCFMKVSRFFDALGIHRVDE